MDTMVIDNVGKMDKFEYMEASGGPGVPCTWTTGAKDGIGTAFHDSTGGSSRSNVWYTLCQGTLTEVYYPNLSQANLKMLELVVTDRRTFTDFESSDTIHEIQLDNPKALVYRQLNRAKSGKYEIEKIYVTDPQQHSLLIHVSFRALVGRIEDYDVFVYVKPILSNTARDDTASVIEHAGVTHLLCYDAFTAMVLSTNVPILKATSGYAGINDGQEELRHSFALNQTCRNARNGNIAMMAQIDLQKGANELVSEFTIALGFGSFWKDAITSAEASLCRSYPVVRMAYLSGWQDYVNTLHCPPVGSVEQYYVAAMVLKAHEDKLNPGAIIASLTIPWGHAVNADNGGVGGYHLIWARDLYHISTALAAVGDRATAKRALQFLDQVQQRRDGSFPQNSWLDGAPYWTGMQLDEVAFPILLADQLNDFSHYWTLVKPAADFILQNGPSTEQERWEENGGFSPSTLAATIAALVVAAKMAHSANDPEADRYLETADHFAAHVDEWTVTHTGSLSTEPYYIRISDTTNPDDGHWIELKNGGGWHPKTDIVDAGFLELVRLGIKRPDDPLIVNSLNVVDQVIRYDTGHVPTWYRYNFDGYGEQQDGSPYCGIGIGRPWPLLAGERGEYEIALHSSRAKMTPKEVFSPQRLLNAMALSANGGFMIPEQIWDVNNLQGHALRADCGTGSATPLAWAMAQYLRLAEAIHQGRIVEMPESVQERYANRFVKEFPINL